MKSAFSFLLLALSAIILVSDENLAQQSTRLTPEQQELVRSIRNIDLKINNRIFNDISREQAVENIINELDPVLVSKYLVFSKHWLKIIGNDSTKQVTRQQFKRWTDSLDKVYECYKEFMGKGPYYMDAIFVDTRLGGIAFARNGGIEFNIEGLHGYETIHEMDHGVPGYTMLHEMGHVFSHAYAPSMHRSASQWIGEPETAADSWSHTPWKKADLQLMGKPVRDEGLVLSITQ